MHIAAVLEINERVLPALKTLQVPQIDTFCRALYMYLACKAHLLQKQPPAERAQSTPLQAC